MRSDKIRAEHSRNRTSVSDEWIEFEDPMASDRSKRRFWYSTRTKQYRYSKPRMQDAVEYAEMRKELEELVARREATRKEEAASQAYERMAASGQIPAYGISTPKRNGTPADVNAEHKSEETPTSDGAATAAAAPITVSSPRSD